MLRFSVYQRDVADVFTVFPWKPQTFQSRLPTFPPSTWTQQSLPSRSPPPTPTPCSSSVGGKKGDLTWCWLGGRWSSGNSWMGHHCAHCSAAPASNIPRWTLSNWDTHSLPPSQFVALVMRRYTHIINKVHFATPPHSEWQANGCAPNTCSHLFATRWPPLPTTHHPRLYTQPRHKKEMWCIYRMSSFVPGHAFRIHWDIRKKKKQLKMKWYKCSE